MDPLLRICLRNVRQKIDVCSTMHPCIGVDVNVVCGGGWKLERSEGRPYHNLVFDESGRAHVESPRSVAEGTEEGDTKIETLVPLTYKKRN
jgi:hypothetical protein